MDKKRKTPSKTIESKLIPFQEVDFYRDAFAQWLEKSTAGKEARSAFFALWALDIFSRVNASALDKEVARARRTLQRFLNSTYKPDK